MVKRVYEALAVIRGAPQRIVLRGSWNRLQEAYRIETSLLIQPGASTIAGKQNSDFSLRVG